MTWLPISLKNAAKCDKWYQLQNLSITESLNANGAWKEILWVQLQACHVSVSNKNQKQKADSVLGWRVLLLPVRWLFCACLRERDKEQNLLSSYPNFIWVRTPLPFLVRELTKKLRCCYGDEEKRTKTNVFKFPFFVPNPIHFGRIGDQNFTSGSQT